MSTMTEGPLVDALGRRRNKAISIILRFKEDEIDPFIDDEVSNQFRKLVLDQLNDFYEVCVDLIGAADGVVNELWLDKLMEIHDAVVRDDDS